MHCISVMEKEVLSKRRKALMVFGTAHLFQKGSTAVAGTVQGRLTDAHVEERARWFRQPKKE